METAAFRTAAFRAAAFKSYYVVWKRIRGLLGEKISSRLNRTM